MERKISLLKSLNDLSTDGIANKNDLSPIYNETVLELGAYKVEPLSWKQLQLALPDGLWKFVSGALLGSLVALSSFADRKKGNERWSSMLLGGLAFGAICGAVGIFIPTLYNLWVNLIAYPILQVVAVLLLARMTSRRKANPVKP
jgi:hypothetical protein